MVRRRLNYLLLTHPLRLTGAPAPAKLVLVKAVALKKKKGDVHGHTTPVGKETFEVAGPAAQFPPGTYTPTAPTQ